MRTIKLLPLVFALTLLPSRSIHAEDAVKMTYAAPTSLPAAICYLAGLKGFFKAEGLEVEEKMFSSGRDALDALLAKKAELQSVSETPIVHALLQGNDIVTIATVSRHKEAKLVARKDKGIAKASDLKGKKLGTAPGTNSDYFMYQFLKANKLSPADVRIVNLKAPEMKVALVNGDIDGYFAWEPHIHYAKKELGANAVVFGPGELYKGNQTVNMNREYAEANPEVVAKVVRALLKAEAYLKKNEKEAKALIAEKLKIDAADIDEMWGDITFKVELDKELLRTMKKIGEWSAELNKRTEPLPDFRKRLLPTALKKEKPGAVTL